MPMSASTVLRWLTAATFAAPTIAQPPSLTAENVCGVFAGSDSFDLPPNATVALELGADAVDASVSAGCLALSQGDRVQLLTNAAANARFGSQSTDAGTTAGGAVSAPQSWLWTLPGQRVGELVVNSNAAATQSAQTSAAIDIDADGSVEFSIAGAHSISLRLPVAARPNGLTVRVVIFARVTLATTQGEFTWQTVNLAWKDTNGPTPVSFGPIDGAFPSCGSALFGEDSPAGSRHRITYTTRNAAPGAQAWLLLGVQPLIPAPLLPGSARCILEVLPVVSLPGTIDPQGAFAWALAVPPPSMAGSVTLFAQVAAFDSGGTTLLTSSGSRGFFPN